MKKFLKAILILIAIVAVIILILFILDKMGRGLGIFSSDKITIPEFDFDRFEFDFLKNGKVFPFII